MKLVNLGKYYTNELQKELNKVDQLVKKLVLTSEMFPEQYECYDENDKQIGYIRVRYGYVRLYCPDVHCDLIYNDNIRFMAARFTDEERLTILPRLIILINNYYKEK